MSSVNASGSHKCGNDRNITVVVHSGLKQNQPLFGILTSLNQEFDLESVQLSNIVFYSVKIEDQLITQLKSQLISQELSELYSENLVRWYLILCDLLVPQNEFLIILKNVPESWKSWASVLHVLADLYYKFNRYKESSKLIELSLKQDPTYFPSLILRAELDDIYGNHDRADVYYKQSFVELQKLLNSDEDLNLYYKWVYRLYTSQAKHFSELHNYEQAISRLEDIKHWYGSECMHDEATSILVNSYIQLGDEAKIQDLLS